MSQCSENHLQALQQQTRTEHGVMVLIDVMDDSLMLAEAACNAPEKLKDLDDTINRLLKEIGDCSTFIRNCIQGKVAALTA